MKTPERNGFGLRLVETSVRHELREAMVKCVEAFAADVRTRHYPEPDHGYTMAPDEVARLKELLAHH